MSRSRGKGSWIGKNLGNRGYASSDFKTVVLRFDFARLLWKGTYKVLCASGVVVLRPIPFCRLAVFGRAWLLWRLASPSFCTCPRACQNNPTKHCDSRCNEGAYHARSRGTFGARGILWTPLLDNTKLLRCKCLVVSSQITVLRLHQYGCDSLMWHSTRMDVVDVTYGFCTQHMWTSDVTHSMQRYHRWYL